MPLRKVFFLACLFVSTACLAGGYALVGSLVGVLLVSFAALSWLLAWKFPGDWLPTTCLFAFIGLAVVGVLTQAPPFLMILGAAASLAAWDLLLLDHSMAGASQAETGSLLERRRVLSLLAVLGVGMFAAGAGRLINYPIPFGVMFLLAVLALFSLDRAARYLADRA